MNTQPGLSEGQLASILSRVAESLAVSDDPVQVTLAVVQALEEEGGLSLQHSGRAIDIVGEVTRWLDAEHRRAADAGETLGTDDASSDEAGWHDHSGFDQTQAPGSAHGSGGGFDD